jgi:predicted TIM-barrel fold metal-dependent hydrolase
VTWVAASRASEDDGTDVASVRAVARRLGIPGLIDLHVHFLPPPIMRSVRAYFAEPGPLVGHGWPIRYVVDEEKGVAYLRSCGVRLFSALPYAHKPGVATYLNDWAAAFADAHPDNLRSATFYPEPSATAEVTARLAARTQLFKLHVQVGGFDLNDPLLDESWGLLEDAHCPVVIHAGSGPVATAYTGPGPLCRLLRRYPRLTVVVAHLGAPEYAEFLGLAETFEHAYLDTTLAFTDFFDAIAPYPRDLLPRLQAVGEKVMLGTDFPNIPYAYAHQLAALERLGLGDDWLRGVLWHNPARLLSLPTMASGPERSAGQDGEPVHLPGPLRVR